MDRYIINQRTRISWLKAGYLAIDGDHERIQERKISPMFRGGEMLNIFC
jgi:hypothetical protein